MALHEFQVTLPSNVQSNKSNTPVSYETELQGDHELNGEWEVALIDITYPHTWYDVHESYEFAIAIPAKDNDDSTHGVIVDERTTTPYLTKRKQQKGSKELTEYVERLTFGTNNKEWIFTTAKIKSGDYPDPNDLIKALVEPLVKLYNDEYAPSTAKTWSDFAFFNTTKHRIVLRTTVIKFVLIAPTQPSTFQLLGYGVKSTKLSFKSDREYELMVVSGPMTTVSAQLPIMSRTISSIFIYTDIVTDSLVGNASASLLGFLPIQSKFGEQGYWAFNPPYYIRVKVTNLKWIRIEIRLDTGELLPIQDGKVICRLHFRRVSALR